MSEKPTAAEASTLYDEGMLNVSSFLYALRDEAGKAAEQLWDEIQRLQKVFTDASITHARLSVLAGTAERAAEREVEHEAVRDDR